MNTSAVLSECGHYRYQLTRDWRAEIGAEQRTIAWVMLNPSTADHREDDPTIRRCIGFARRWGYGCMRVANLYGLRATDPKVLKQVADPIGPDNDWWLWRTMLNADLIVAAWGAHRPPEGAISKMLARAELCCLGTTKAGLPRHPLYMPNDSAPLLYSWIP